MNKPREILIQKLIDLRNQGYSEKTLSEEKTKDSKKELRELFGKITTGERWHQIVRYVFFNSDEKKFLVERIMRLSLDHTGSFDKFFEIGESGNSIDSYRLWEFIKLRSLVEEYFEIYSKIINKINFDYPSTKFSGRMVKGKILWAETIRKNPTKYPLMFETKNWVREFETPENIILLLCSVWIIQDIEKIVNQRLSTPLNVDEKQILEKIRIRTKNILNEFHFNEVTKKAKQYSYYERTSSQISKLSLEFSKRLDQGLIKNSQYGQLKLWIHKYNQLNLDGVNKQKIISLNNVEDIDELYEVLVFLEFFNFLKRVEKVDAKIIQSKEPGITSKRRMEFFVDGQKVKFYHERIYPKSEGWTWIMSPAKPDFSAVLEKDEQIIAVFDAKNNHGHSKDLETISKYHKRQKDAIEGLKERLRDNIDKFLEKWPELNPNILETFFQLFDMDPQKAALYKTKIIEHHQKHISKNSKEFKTESFSITDKKKDAIKILLQYMINLDANYGGIIFPRFGHETFVYPNKNTRFIPKNFGNMKLEYYQVGYSEKDVSEKNIAFASMYQSILDGIRLPRPKIVF